MTLFAVIALLFGIIIGSFLNVVILRYNTGKGLNGRSECLSCQKPLSWKELVPIISFFALLRRCRGCEAKLRWQYPLVELATGILFVLIYLRIEYLLYESVSMFAVLFVLNVIIWSTLIIIFVYDLYHTIIPNIFVYLFIACSGVLMCISLTQSLSAQGMTSLTILDVCGGALFLLPFFVLWDISDGKWIGLGDGKLALGIGLLLGFVHGLSALVLAFWIGALFSVGYLLYMRFVAKKGRSEITHEIPFAPFMIIATLILYIFPLDILNIGIFLLGS